MARSVGGNFFGGYHDAAGIVMAVACEEVHPVMQPPHHASDFGELFAKIGELFAEVHHLIFKALDASSESAQFTYDPTHGERLADLKAYQGDQHQGDEGQKAVEDV